jgi:hypothetical protein
MVQIDTGGLDCENFAYEQAVVLKRGSPGPPEEDIGQGAALIWGGAVVHIKNHAPRGAGVPAYLLGIIPAPRNRNAQTLQIVWTKVALLNLPRQRKVAGVELGSLA